MRLCLECQPMDCTLKHEMYRIPQIRLKPLSVLGCFFLLVVLPTHSLQVGSPTAPIKVSSKEADDHLQVKVLKPEYPPEARAKGIEGTVRLRVVIDERGNVVDTKVMSGNALLIPPAIVLVKRFPYRPFTRGNKRVSVTTDVDVPFELHPVNAYQDWNAHRDPKMRHLVRNAFERIAYRRSQQGERTKDGHGRRVNDAKG